MNIDKLTHTIKYEFILKHPELKIFFDNYHNKFDQLKHKYDLYSLVYITFNKKEFNNEEYTNEAYIYLGLNNNNQHVFILCNINIFLVYGDVQIDDNDIKNNPFDNKHQYLINKINLPKEIYEKYLKCLIETYSIINSPFYL